MTCGTLQVTPSRPWTNSRTSSHLSWPQTWRFAPHLFIRFSGAANARPRESSYYSSAQSLHEAQTRRYIVQRSNHNPSSYVRIALQIFYLLTSNVNLFERIKFCPKCEITNIMYYTSAVYIEIQRNAMQYQMELVNKKNSSHNFGTEVNQKL